MPSMFFAITIFRRRRITRRIHILYWGLFEKKKKITKFDQNHLKNFDRYYKV